MNVTDIESTLVEYVRENLSPTESERAYISKRYNQLSDFLDKRTFQNGSYARYTSTTPVNDLDVMYILPDDVVKSIKMAEAKINRDALDIGKIIESLANQLKEFYGSSATIKPQPHSVGIYFGTEDEFSIDVVPAVSADRDMFWVPESAHISVANRRKLYTSGRLPSLLNWIKSDPIGYIEQSTAVDKNTGGRFRKAAKAIKKWRWRCKNGDSQFPLKSFHLELAVTELFHQKQDNICLSVIKQFIDNIPALISKPKFPDRADQNRFVDEYVSKLSPLERQLVMDYYRIAQRELVILEQSKSPAEAKVALERFLGITNSASTTSLSTRTTSVPAGTPISGPVKVTIGLKGLVADKKRDTGEQFLSDFGISTELKYTVKINAKVIQDGFRPFKLLGNLFPLKKRRRLEFHIEYCNAPEPYQIKWKVKNTGSEATKAGDLRGKIYDDQGYGGRTETTKYWGNHYVECYIIKNGICVAADHIDVDIGRD